MKNDIYSKLCAHLNTGVIGAPESEEFLAILQLKYTPEEAELALHVPLLPQDLSKIAQSAGKPEGEVKRILEQMADKGLVETVSGKPELRGIYRLLPTIVGMFETSFSKGEADPRSEQLARLWWDYIDRDFEKEIHRGKTPLTRVISVEKSIPSNLAVLSCERASGIVNKMSYIAVMTCMCRHSARLARKGCDHPDDVCLHFEDFARFLVERGLAKEITREQALDVLDRADKAGLIHVTFNIAKEEECIGLCSCCACCCVQLRGISHLHKSGAVGTSRFLPVVNADECIACGICEDRCQFDAIKVIEDSAGVEEEKCVGCGLCVTGCPVEAVSLKERSTYQQPIPDIMKLVETAFKEKAQ